MPIGLGQKQHDRRRRVLRDERVGDEAASEGTRRRSRRRPPHRYGAGARRQRQPAVLDLLPRRWPALLATSSLSAVLVSILLLAVWGATAGGPLASWQLWQASDVSAMLSRGVSWFGSLTMLGVAVVAFQLYLLRKHRRDDYQGHYAVWIWAAVFSLLTASDLSIGWGAWAIETIAGSLGLPAWAVTLWMLAPTCAISVRLGFEVRESRASLSLLVSTAVLTISGLVANRVLTEPVLLARVSSATVLVGAAGAWFLALWHLRFVVVQVHSPAVVQGDESADVQGEEVAETRDIAWQTPPVATAAPSPAKAVPVTAAKTISATVSGPTSGVESLGSVTAKPSAVAAAASGLGDRIASVSRADEGSDEAGDEDGDEEARRGGMSKAQRRKLAKQERRRQRDAA